ncbi:MAG: hypothetical protein GX957_12100 [Clostridiaceae bacterium]|jgi:D-3-phosphoglycerate dehydrogenase|nr:hypothetical protein [Clostridiaceae bacterium]
MEDVLKNSDFISIHSPLTKETYRMIGKNEIKLMKKGAYIINLGRGGIIDEDELYKALVENRIAGAALDVLEKEPPQDTKLLGLDNVIVTPHTGAGTMEAQNYISISLANQVLEYMNSFRWNKF